MMLADRTAGGAASEVVKAVLDVTPVDMHGTTVIAWKVRSLRNVDMSVPEAVKGDPAPIAARQAAAVLRWLAGWAAENDWRTHGQMLIDNLTNVADEIDGGDHA